MSSVHTKSGAKFQIEQAIEQALELGLEYGLKFVNQGVYVIFAENAVYVGQSGDINSRPRQHSKRFGPTVHQALRIPVPKQLKGKSHRETREFYEQLVLDHYKDHGYDVYNLREPVGKRRRKGFLLAVAQWVVKLFK